MIDERTEEQASLYVLDLLPEGDRAVFAAQLEVDAELRDFVRSLRATTGDLAFTAHTSPPAELKARLLRRIRRDPAASTGLAPAPVIPFRVPSWVPWAAAACLALLAGWLGREHLVSREEIFLLGTETRLAEIARKDAENRLAAERIILNHQLEALTSELKTQGDLAQLKIAALSSMLGNSPESLAVAVWNPSKQEGVLTVEKLPAAAADQDYELWMIDPRQPRPVSGGIFSVGADGHARVSFKPEEPVEAAKFAVTRERKGGAPRLSGPQGQVIMISR